MQTQDEAKQKECDYLFYSEARKEFANQNMPKGQMAAQMATSMLSMAGPVGGILSALLQRMTIKDLSQSVQAKEEISFAYRVTQLDGTVTMPQVKTNLKSKKQGDDIITPQIKDAVSKVLGQLIKKR